MVKPKDKSKAKKKQSNAVEKLGTEKENVLSVRRSKRKVAASKNYAESPDDPNTRKTAAKSKTKADSNETHVQFSTETSKEDKKTDSVEPASPEKIATDTSLSTLTEDSRTLTPSNKVFEENTPGSCFTVRTPTTDEVTSRNTEAPPVKIATDVSISTLTEETLTEDSGYGPSNKSTPCSFFIVRTPTQDKGPSQDTETTQYWKELAEQFRISLDKALHENESMYDQMIALEAENSQLKELVREGENLASIVKGIIE